MDPTSFLLLAAVALAENCAATAFIVRDPLLTLDQRRYQLILAWCLPLLGSAIVIGVNRAQASRFQPQLPPAGDTTAEPNVLDYYEDAHNSEPPPDPDK